MKWVILNGAVSAAFSRSPVAGLIRTGWTGSGGYNHSPYSLIVSFRRLVCLPRSSVSRMRLRMR